MPPPSLTGRARFSASLRRPTNVTNPESTLDSIAGAVKELLETNHLDPKEIEAIGFGIPGLVDAEKGIGIASVNLGWENVPVRAGLESRLGTRCVIENDVRTGAIGEAHFGAGKGLKYLVYLNIGTGISATIILDGKIFTGINGLAGEIGHAVQEPGGLPCKCGGHGCLEAVSSGPGIAARALEKIKNGRPSILSTLPGEIPQALTASQVFEAAIRGDPVSCETLSEVGTLTAHALQYLALAYDPNVIVIGGGVVQSSEILYQKIQDTLEHLASESWVFRKVYRRDLVRLSSLGNDAGVLGAAALIA